MNIVELLTQREFLIAVLAAISAAAVVFTFGSSMIVRQDMKKRIKRVAVERDRMRAEEMARLRGSSGADGRSSIRRGKEPKSYMKRAVERLDLKKAFQDDTTVDKLAMAGLRGQGELTKFLFQRLVYPIDLGADIVLCLAIGRKFGSSHSGSLIFVLRQDVPCPDAFFNCCKRMSCGSRSRERLPKRPAKCCCGLTVQDACPSACPLRNRA